MGPLSDPGNFFFFCVKKNKSCSVGGNAWVCWKALKNSNSTYDKNWPFFHLVWEISNVFNPNLARGAMVIVAGYGHGDTSSNPGRDWLHFT